jgi:hypothetical protein
LTCFRAPHIFGSNKNAGFGLEIQKVAQNVPEVIATMDAFVKKLLMPFFVQITIVVLVLLSNRTALSAKCV